MKIKLVNFDEPTIYYSVRDISFSSWREAKDWMSEKYEYADNFRMAHFDTEEEILKFKKIEEKGCCGCANLLVKIDGKECLIGCNFGH